jgi:hypothetical protein
MFSEHLPLNYLISRQCNPRILCSQALTSTSDGDVVVWDEQGMSAQMGTRATDRRTIKVMRLHGAAIHHLSCIGGFVVTGGTAAVHFDSAMSAHQCAGIHQRVVFRVTKP